MYIHMYCVPKMLYICNIMYLYSLCYLQILPEVQDGSHGDRQQPADLTEGERQQVEGIETSVSVKQVTLPELVAKSPPPWPGHVDKKHAEPFYKIVPSGKSLPGVLHHQKKRQVGHLCTSAIRTLYIPPLHVCLTCLLQYHNDSFATLLMSRHYCTALLAMFLSVLSTAGSLNQTAQASPQSSQTALSSAT